MPKGLQIYNSTGTLQFDTTNRAFRLLTTLETGIVNGSTVVPTLTQGTPLVVATPDTEEGFFPTVTVSGTTVTWDWGGLPEVNRVNNRLDILVY